MGLSERQIVAVKYTKKNGAITLSDFKAIVRDVTKKLCIAIYRIWWRKKSSSSKVKRRAADIN